MVGELGVRFGTNLTRGEPNLGSQPYSEMTEPPPAKPKRRPSGPSDIKMSNCQWIGVSMDRQNQGAPRFG